MSGVRANFGWQYTDADNVVHRGGSATRGMAEEVVRWAEREFGIDACAAWWPIV